MIGAVIVLYNPEIGRLRKNILSIADQVLEIRLEDNGSDNIDDIKCLIENIKDTRISIDFIRQNRGIAYALNRGMEFFLKRNFEWVITLDQDSIVPSDMIEKYFKYMPERNVGLVCPHISYDGDKDLNNKISSDVEYVQRCITSANMVKISAWEKIGGYDEKMFIDYVDFDFCQSLLEYGYTLVKVNAVILDHQLGHLEYARKFVWFGKATVQIYNHSSWRTYFYVRNTIYYIKKHKKRISIYKECKTLVYWIGKKLIYEKNRWSCLKIVMRGVLDGLKIEVKD